MRLGVVKVGNSSARLEIDDFDRSVVNGLLGEVWEIEKEVVATLEVN